ncbi:MAG: AAA family ATPase [Brachymonas sp.]|nr:AAA family ATPase [Brachymonas sp.]
MGAESTGKSQLATELAAQLCAQGISAIAVSEYLREWCEREGRVPQQPEQAHIAHTQQTRIEAATAQASCVIADTTPLITAVYSEFIFSDTHLHLDALAYQKSFDLTLVTGLDMPWLADGIQRDGAHVRPPVDALLRRLLHSASIPFEVIYGQGAERCARALQAVQRIQDTMNSIAPRAGYTPANTSNRLKNWQSSCEKCSDPDCEHRLFQALKIDAAS